MDRRELILRNTIREWASTGCDPFPCGISVWRYVCEVSGVPAPELPDHRERKAMQTLLRREGGLEQYSRSLMLGLGWSEITDPARGDVAVVKMPEMGLTCAISLGRTWMAKGKGFVLTLPAPHVAAWRFDGCLKPSPPPLLPPSD